MPITSRISSYRPTELRGFGALCVKITPAAQTTEARALSHQCTPTLRALISSAYPARFGFYPPALTTTGSGNPAASGFSRQADGFAGSVKPFALARVRLPQPMLANAGDMAPKIASARSGEGKLRERISCLASSCNRPLESGQPRRVVSCAISSRSLGKMICCRSI